MLSVQLLQYCQVEHPAQSDLSSERRNTMLPQPKQIKEVDTKKIREQLGLDSMSMTIEQQVLAIIEENEASLAGGAAKGLNIVA